MKNNTQTEPTDWSEIFDATFNYVAPCLKGNCHQGAHIYDEQGNCCELKDIKDFIRLQRLEAQRQEREKVLAEIYTEIRKFRKDNHGYSRLSAAWIFVKNKLSQLEPNNK
jgi:hypothetical protein